jgi:hypothetical protein
MRVSPEVLVNEAGNELGFVASKISFVHVVRICLPLL